MLIANLSSPRKGLFFLILASALLMAALIGCATAPYTGRKQVLMVSPEREQTLGYQAFSQIEKHSRLSPDQALKARVREVGERIARVADRPDFHWEFVVFEDDKVANAFCLPGGKVGIYSGLFKYIHSDADLATVISHEVGHALARHAAERLSQARLSQIGGTALNVGLAALGVGGGVGNLAMQGYGMASKLGVLLPYNRIQESEADRIGLILMAKAGYDPQDAVQFWEHFAGDKKTKAQLPQFLSTHPSDSSRIQSLRTFLPEARQYYK